MGRVAGSTNRRLAECGTMAGFRRHYKLREVPCSACKDAKSADRRKRGNPQREGIGFGKRDQGADLLPGITSGFDARCSCTWAPMASVYQVKARDVNCVNHGGSLESALARAARLAGAS